MLKETNWEGMALKTVCSNNIIIGILLIINLVYHPFKLATDFLFSLKCSLDCEIKLWPLDKRVFAETFLKYWYNCYIFLWPAMGKK